MSSRFLPGVIALSLASLLASCAPEPVVLVLEDTRGSLADVERVDFSLENAEQDLTISDSGLGIESSFGSRTLFIDYFAWVDVVNSSDEVTYEFEFEFGALDADGATWAVKDTNYGTYRILPGESVRVIGELRSARDEGEPVEPVVGIRATDFLFADVSLLSTPEATVLGWDYDSESEDITGSGSVSNTSGSQVDDMEVIVWCTDEDGVPHADEVSLNQLPLAPGAVSEFLFSWSVDESYRITDCEAQVIVSGDTFDDPA